MARKKSEIKAAKDEWKRKDFRVSIFGSARAKVGDPEYKQVYQLGKLLGESGIDIVTGSGPGIMRAANRGHREGRKDGAHSIGLAIKLPFEQKESKSDIVRKFSNFSNRLDNFMLLSNVVVVTPGGIGTFLELFYTWQLVQVKHICNIPIILLGDMWPDLIKWMEKWPLKKGFISKGDLGMIFLAKDYNEAIEMIERAYKEYKKGNKNYCLNYKRYKLK